MDGVVRSTGLGVCDEIVKHIFKQFQCKEDKTVHLDEIRPGLAHLLCAGYGPLHKLRMAFELTTMPALYEVFAITAVCQLVTQVCYASGGGGQHDSWSRQMAGGEPIRTNVQVAASLHSEISQLCGQYLLNGIAIRQLKTTSKLAQLSSRSLSLAMLGPAEFKHKETRSKAGAKGSRAYVP